MKKILKRLIPALILLGLIAAAIWYWGFREEPGERNEITIYGNIDIRQVDLAFNGTERIADIRVEEGQTVQKGDLLAQLDTRKLKLAVERSAARMEAQAKTVEKLLAGTRSEEIGQARARADAVRKRAENARRTYERLRPLAADNLASKDTVDAAKAKADSEAANLKAAMESVNLAESGPRKEDIAGAQATLKVLAVELDIARQNLADANLYASADGIVRNRILEPGDMASPGRPVLTLALTDPIWVRAYISETELGRIHPGMGAMVMSDSFPNKTYPAWIGYISPTAEFTPKTVETTDVRTHLVYQIRVFVCNPENELRLGMPVTVVIPLNVANGKQKNMPPPCRPRHDGKNPDGQDPDDRDQNGRYRDDG